MGKITVKHRNLFVVVKFHNYDTDSFDSDEYTYWINTDKDIKKGDYLILKDDDATWDALKVVHVEHAEEVQPGKEYPKSRTKALIGTADCDMYFGRKERKRKAKEIMDKIEKVFAEAEKMALYAKLAETNPELKALLAEYSELMKDD